MADQVRQRLELADRLAVVIASARKVAARSSCENSYQFVLTHFGVSH
jgi:hypothetical protein